MANPSTGRQHREEERTNPAQAAANKGKEAAGNLAEKARDAASTVGRTVSGAASTVGERAEDAAAAVGRGMESLGGTIRERGPQEGVLGRATETVAGALESGGRYLEEQGLSGMFDDLTNVIRRNPIPAILAGIGVGFLLARAMRR